MNKMHITITMFLMTSVVLTQEWVEHGGVDYNCDVLNAILVDYGDTDFMRSSTSITTLKDYFAIFLPKCPKTRSAATEHTVALAGNTGTETVENLYSFNSADAGQQPVLGPLLLAEGIYVFTATTDGYMSVAPQSLSGGCGFDLEIGIFNLWQGEGSDGVQSVVEAEADCQVLLEISNATESWILDIVSADNLTAEAASSDYLFTSADKGLSPVLGPLLLAKGIYVFTAATDGYMSVVPQSLSGNCGFDLEIGIFSLSQGEGSDGAQSVVEVEADCQVLLEISNAAENWMLDIKKLS